MSADPTHLRDGDRDVGQVAAEGAARVVAAAAVVADGVELVRVGAAGGTREAGTPGAVRGGVPVGYGVDVLPGGSRHF